MSITTQNQYSVLKREYTPSYTYIIMEVLSRPKDNMTTMVLWHGTPKLVYGYFANVKQFIICNLKIKMGANTMNTKINIT